MAIDLKIAVPLLALALLLPVGGCMVGPDYSRPQTAADTAEGYANAEPEDPNVPANLDNQWWENFGDDVTAELVREALDDNYDLKIAAARVLQSRGFLREVRGRKYPEVFYNASRDRSKRSFNFGGLGGGGRFSVITTTWQQNFSINWLVDFWGKLRHAEKAAFEQLLASSANQQAVRHTIIAEVIKARIEIATLQNRLEIARATTASRKKTLEIVERRYAEGLVGPVDIRLARENLASAQSVEPSVERSLIIAGHALDVLLGRAPATSERLPRTLSDLPELEPVPVGLPALLLERRPDIRAAEYALQAANDQVGVSISMLFPDFTFAAGWGRSGDVWEDIWMDETEIYNALFSVAQPVFRGGQIRGGIDQAKAQYKELAIAYGKTVLTAMREVEDALVSENKFREQYRYALKQLSEAAAAEELSRSRYQRGVESILTVLESERRRRLAEEQVAILKGRIWDARVNLFLALGGDWVNEEEQNNDNNTVAKDEE